MSSNSLAIAKERSITPEFLKSGSTVLVLEAATAIQLGKLAPLGYKEAVDFFRNESGRTTLAHNAWLLAEAEVAGKLEVTKQEFPDAERSAQAILTAMEQNHPGTLETMRRRIAAPDWSISSALAEQITAITVFNLFLSPS